MIAKLWRWLFGGCEHEWETIRAVKLESIDMYDHKSMGVRYTLRCKKCGWVKKRDLV